MTELATVYTNQISTFISTIEIQLKEITQAQNELLKNISELNSITLEEEKEIEALKINMSKVSTYNTKLLSLKATMSMLTGRSKQLIERSNKLKQMKLKYLSQVDSIRKIEQEKDLVIAAKSAIPIPTTPSPSTSSSPIQQLPEQTIENHATTPNILVTIPKLKSTLKKKKKTKVREALIDDDQDTSSWAVPKKSLSQKDLLPK